MSDWVALITGLATVVLVAITAYYAKRTSDIAEQTQVTADATKLMADETRKMVAATQEQVSETRAQREAQARPVVTFTLLALETEWEPPEGVDHTVPTITRFGLEVRNVGSGPALNVVVDAEATEGGFQPGDRITRHFNIEVPVSTSVLGVGDSRFITYRWRKPKPDTPLQDDEAANLFSNDWAVQQPVRQKYQDDGDSINRLVDYRQALVQRPVKYTLRAVYTDAYGSVWSSRAPLDIPYRSPAEWASEVKLGDTVLDGPNSQASQ